MNVADTCCLICKFCCIVVDMFITLGGQVMFLGGFCLLAGLTNNSVTCSHSVKVRSTLVGTMDQADGFLVMIGGRISKT